MTCIHVLYGTVTGNAEEIARRIHSSLPDYKLPQGKVFCLSDYAKLDCFQPAGPNAHVVVVVSTTGDGDPPETIRPFMRLLRKKDKKLSNISFAVLALGDTNYENFCNTGKRVDVGLEKLGANRFYKRGEADDGVGLELVVEPWLQGLWPLLEKAVAVEKQQVQNGKLEKEEEKQASGGDKKEDVKEMQELEGLVKKVTIAELGFDEAKLPKVFAPKLSVSVVENGEKDGQSCLSLSQSYIADEVVCSWITDAKKLTSEDADKTVWHMEVTCDEKSRFKRAYCAGDAFGIIVENDGSEVDRFLKVLHMDGGQVVKVVKDSGDLIAIGTIVQFVKQRMDLRAVPKKALLRCMSDYCTDIEERRDLLHLCSRDGRKRYSEELVGKNMSIVEVLEQKARSCRAPIALFLDQLPCVAPRWYSATSSPELDGRSVLQFAFSVVENGLATRELSSKCEKFLKGEKSGPVLLIPRESDSMSHFRPPTLLETGYIMIGPGTGVAPFRGFLREREAQLKKNEDGGKVGKTILFFGCRYADKDFLYRDDLVGLEEGGVLSSLDVAISRGGKEKVYVQDRLKVRKEEVARIVADGGHIYVCGDGGGMAESVHRGLGGILAEAFCGGNEDDGMNMLRQLGEQHRYVRDIWYYGRVAEDEEM